MHVLATEFNCIKCGIILQLQLMTIDSIAGEFLHRP